MKEKMSWLQLCQREARRIRVLPSAGARCLLRCNSQAPPEQGGIRPEAAGERLGDTSAADTKDRKYSMSFAEYRKLKKSMKTRSKIAGIPMGFTGIGISSAISIQLNPRMFEMTPEEIQPILGMDPIMLAAACGVVSGIAGFVMGGALFSATWKLVAKNKYMELQWRDEDFLQRLQKYRYTGINKYDDDYYGDKVMTLSDYRQWVRQQQKKREHMEARNAAAAAAKET